MSKFIQCLKFYYQKNMFSITLNLYYYDKKTLFHFTAHCITGNRRSSHLAAFSLSLPNDCMRPCMKYSESVAWLGKGPLSVRWH